MKTALSIVERAASTAIQSALAYISVDSFTGNKTTALHTLELAAIAAGISFVKNVGLYLQSLPAPLTPTPPPAK